MNGAGARPKKNRPKAAFPGGARPYLSTNARSNT
ncbi:Uncharacterised protein [Bordetella pertussis]|nr:Uncharacterised protein [Bordetella pertussis]CFP63578.1 Uncharacterised protein [Bordetella pertussis]